MNTRRPGGRLGVHDALAGLAGSYVGLVLALVVLLFGLNMPEFLPPAIAVATPMWIVAVLVLGLPGAAWIERRLPAHASFARRYGVYAVGGVASGAVVALVPLLGFTYGELGRSMAAITFACAVASALGGRAGIDLGRRASRALAR